MKRKTIALTAVCTLFVWACDNRERNKVEANAAEQLSPVNTALANTARLLPAPSSTETSSSMTDVTVRNTLAVNPATVGASLGRTFQGEIVADVFLPNKSQPAAFRYMASGDRMRMRLDGSTSDFDVIAEGKTLAVLNHGNHSFRKFDLPDVDDGPVSKGVSGDRKNDLKISKNEDAVTFQAGLRCEEHTITGAHTEIHACVAGLPGAFERGLFERATGVQLPAWLAALVDNEGIPLRARGHHGNSGDFTLTVTRYSAEPLADASFLVPSNYVQDTAAQPNASNKVR